MSDPFPGLPRQHYGVIWADPPWQFRSWSDKGRDRCPDAMVRQKGLAERHYPVMSRADLLALPVGELAAPDCCLFMWVVDCHLPEAMALAEAWGFTFKTKAFCWIKQSADGTCPIGLGYWTRSNPEDCWLFTKGKPKRRSAGVRKLVTAPRQAHSEKPACVRSRIMDLCDGPYLELFARQRAEDWDAWGNQLDT